MGSICASQKAADINGSKKTSPGNKVQPNKKIQEQEEEEDEVFDEEAEAVLEEKAQTVIRNQRKKTFVNRRSKDNFFEFLEESFTAQDPKVFFYSPSNYFRSLLSIWLERNRGGTK